MAFILYEDLYNYEYKMYSNYRLVDGKSGFVSYTKNGFNDNDQIDLTNRFKQLSNNHAYCMMSNSDPKNTNTNDNLFDDLYQKYNIERVYALRCINRDSTGRGRITELLIRNYQ